jgi:hypothetical protein
MLVETDKNRLLSSGKDQLAGETISMSITIDMLRIVETMSSEVITNIYIRNILFTSVGYMKKKELFCFLSHDDRLGRNGCHLVDLPAGTPKRCCEAIGFAFEALRKQTKPIQNVFEAVADDDGEVPESLTKLAMDRSDLSPLRILGSGTSLITIRFHI